MLDGVISVLTVVLYIQNFGVISADRYDVNSSLCNDSFLNQYECYRWFREVTELQRTCPC